MTDASRVCASLMTLLPEFDFSFENAKNVLLGHRSIHIYISLGKLPLPTLDLTGCRWVRLC